MPLTNDLTDYCSEWPQQFLAERDALQVRLGALVCSIHHIGSTAIPGMIAKPEIDILMIVEDFRKTDTINCAMESLGYRVRGQSGPAESHYYSRNTDGVRTHKAHIYRKGNPRIWAHFAFRDYLIDHPDLAAEYGTLKSTLARENTGGMTEYLAGKDEFVKAVLLLAEHENYVEDRISPDCENVPLGDQ